MTTVAGGRSSVTPPAAHAPDMEPEPPVAAKVHARPELLNRKSADGRQDSRVTIPIEAALAPAMVNLLGSSRMRTKGSIIMIAAAPLLAVLKGCRVLVVEDEFFQAKDLARTLSEAGAVPVGPVPSFRDAVEALDRNDVIDAAVLDINLRGQIAYEVADVLANRGHGCRVWRLGECAPPKLAAIPAIASLRAGCCMTSLLMFIGPGCRWGNTACRAMFLMDGIKNVGSSLRGMALVRRADPHMLPPSR